MSHLFGIVDMATVIVQLCRGDLWCWINNTHTCPGMLQQREQKLRYLENVCFAVCMVRGQSLLNTYIKLSGYMSNQGDAAGSISLILTHLTSKRKWQKHTVCLSWMIKPMVVRGWSWIKYKFIFVKDLSRLSVI